ncbi:non-specific lipid-transfer protein 1-like [Solanum lycopersicum]|uniref:non-specific lipid-transfer protein 1-like n=1 Tax=Solanum lycopersicum TaxID=4081 RepID=UPI00374A5C62
MVAASFLTLLFASSDFAPLKSLNSAMTASLTTVSFSSSPNLLFRTGSGTHCGAQIIDKQFHESGCSDREAICLCLKNAAQTLPIDLQKAAKFPALCNLDYISIDPNVDCSK